MKKSGAQILCESLIKEGVEVIFGYQGGVVIPFFDQLPKYPKLRFILVRHEQGAAFAANGYARATGKLGVCIATSGPGATNLITGLTDGHMDSVPVLAITGQVSTSTIGSDAFQETDITGMTQPITKQNWVVDKTEDLARVVKEAVHIATTGRPGVVHIDLPKDVTMGESEYRYPRTVNLPGYQIPKGQLNQEAVQKAANLINESKKTVIFSGHGIIISEAYKELKELAEKAEIPVIATLNGLTGIPHSHPLFYGMMGMHGTVAANRAIVNSDLIIALGMRFDDRVTGRLEEYAPDAKIIHVDIDAAEHGKVVQPTVSLVNDVKKTLKAIIPNVRQNTHKQWIKQLDEYRNQSKKRDTKTLKKKVGPTNKPLISHIVHTLNQITKGQSTIVADVGQHQMFAARYYEYENPNSFFSSGGLGAMGFSLPAAMGIKVARPKEDVWVVCGDGGFQMNNQELMTLVQDKINLKVLIMNNAHLGMVRQWQQLFFNRNYVATPISSPDFVKLADAFGLWGKRVTKAEEVEPTLREVKKRSGTSIVEFVTEPEENIFPMVAPGAALSELRLEE